MTTYQNIFSGNLISPSQVSYNAISLTSNLALSWPLETAPSGNLLTDIVDVSSNGAYTITLPPANQTSNGQASIFVNRSAFAITLSANDGTVVVSAMPSGSVFFVYVSSNTTVGGTWGSFQYGSQASAVNAAQLAGNGLVAVGSLLSQSIPVSSKGVDYAVGASDRAIFLNWIGGSGTITLPLATTVGANWYTQIRNSGTSALTVALSGSDTINGVASLTMSVGDSAFIVTDGASWFTIGLGAAVNNNFNPVSINVGGLSGTYVLPANQYGKTAYTFFGALAGNLQIVVPASSYQYWVDNQTSGGFTLTIGISGQPSPPSIAAGARNIYYYNPFEAVIIPINTTGVSLPLVVASGGTGATTASGARSNLGSTSVGDAVFTASTTLVAQTALAAPSTADAMIFAMSFG